MAVELTTPVGRLVFGHPTKSRTKTNQQRQPLLKDGQPVQQWVFGVAFDKAQFQATIWPAMEQEARTIFPSGAPPAFSWKWKDGDGVDRELLGHRAGVPAVVARTGLAAAGDRSRHLCRARHPL